SAVAVIGSEVLPAEPVGTGNGIVADLAELTAARRLLNRCLPDRVGELQATRVGRVRLVVVEFGDAELIRAQGRDPELGERRGATRPRVVRPLELGVPGVHPGADTER